jgi:hypothetical protein
LSARRGQPILGGMADGGSMEDRFLRSGAVTPARRRPSLDPRRWPWWTRPPALFLTAAAVSAGVGLLVAAWKDYDPVSGATWGLYGGGTVLLMIGVAPFMGESSAPTLGGFGREAHDLQRGRLGDALSTLAYLVFGAALIGLGLVLELYA